MKTSVQALLLFVCVVLLAPAAHAAAPNVIQYQGRVRVDGVDFNGSGSLKFVIHRDGNVWWRSSADGNGDGEPDTAIVQSVTNGLFTVGLGDTAIPNMAALTFVDPTDPQNAGSSTAPPLLRIWFNDGVSGFSQLSPDQPLSSAPFALFAARIGAGTVTESQLANGAVTAGKLAAGAVGSAAIAGSSINSSHLAPGAVTAADLATGLRSSMDAPDGNPTNVVRVDRAGLVQAGPAGETNTLVQSSAVLNLWGGVRTVSSLIPIDSFGTSRILSGQLSGGFRAALDGGSDVELVGTTAYVVARDDHTFTIINNTDSNAPVIIAQLQDGVAGVTSLSSPEAVEVVGNFAYVVSRGADNAFTIINITSPSLPVVSAVRSDGVGGFNDLSSPSDVVVTDNGNTAFVSSEVDDAVTVINVANKSNPTLVTVLKDEVGGVTTLNGPRQLLIAGTRLYVRSSEAITIFNISAPATPTLVGTIPNSKRSMAVVGNTLIDSTSSELETWDVTGSIPVLRNRVSLRDFFPEGGVAYGVDSMSVDGTNLWATSFATEGRERVMVFDVTTPALPVLTTISAGMSSYGNYILETFMTQPTRVVGYGGNSAVVLNSTPGAFVNVRKASLSTGVSLTTEGNVGIRTSHPLAALHVFGGTLIEEGGLIVGSGAINAFAESSLAVGRNNIVRADHSAALGEGLLLGASDISSGPQVAVGKFNVPSTAGNTIRFAVGNGVSGARTNAFTVTDSGRIGLNGVAAPTHSIEHASGAHLTTGGVWVNASDRNLKENVEPASNQEVLRKLAQMPIYTWNYKAESPDRLHLGPMAQDFHAAFGLGDDNRTISTVDANGVALSAIQALIEENRSLKARLEAIEQKLPRR